MRHIRILRTPLTNWMTLSSMDVEFVWSKTRGEVVVLAHRALDLVPVPGLDRVGAAVLAPGKAMPTFLFLFLNIFFIYFSKIRNLRSSKFCNYNRPLFFVSYLYLIVFISFDFYRADLLLIFPHYVFNSSRINRRIVCLKTKQQQKFYCFFVDAFD